MMQFQENAQIERQTEGYKEGRAEPISLHPSCYLLPQGVKNEEISETCNYAQE